LICRIGEATKRNLHRFRDPLFVHGHLVSAVDSSLRYNENLNGLQILIDNLAQALSTERLSSWWFDEKLRGDSRAESTGGGRDVIRVNTVIENPRLSPFKFTSISESSLLLRLSCLDAFSYTITPPKSITGITQMTAQLLKVHWMRLFYQHHNVPHIDVQPPKPHTTQVHNRRKDTDRVEIIGLDSNTPGT
jgi:hypothetical protein